MKRNIGLITALIATFYWVSESLVDTICMEDRTFLERLLIIDTGELIVRSTVLALIVAFGIYSAHVLSKLRRSDERLVRMNASFLDFGPDPVDNINRLTALSGELLKAAAAFYNRLEQGQIAHWGTWCPSGDLSRENTPRGHICRDLIEMGGDEVMVINNLPETTYAGAETCISTCGLHTYMGKTVSLGGLAVGSLSVIFKEQYSPKEEDKQLMGIIASAIGVEENRRLSRVALQESEERLRHLSSELLTAQEKERRRLALQLHDSVGQSLSALKFGIEETLESLTNKVEENQLKPLRVSVPLIRQIVAEIRQIQKDLYPATLDDLGIIATINSFCKQYRGIYRNLKLTTQFTLNENEVPVSLKPVIYRVLQEAMNNVAKHSKAASVSISLHKEATSLQLLIEDDGRGFDATTHFKKGLGLSSMKERAELSGGEFQIDSQDGGGTRITVSWPFDERGFSRL